MAAVITTPFDDAVENDIALEMINNQPPGVVTTLKNAENVYKSFLYLREMYSKYPNKETILDMATIQATEPTQIEIPADTNYIVVSNLSDQQATININDKVYTFNAYEKEKFPIVASDTVKLQGSISYILKNIQEF